MMPPATSRAAGVFGSIVFYPVPGDGRAYLAAATTPPMLQESVRRLLELRTGTAVGDDSVATFTAVERCSEQLSKAITLLSLEVAALDALPASITVDKDPLTADELDRIRRGNAPEGVAGAT